MAEMDYLPGGIKERLEDLRNRRKLTLKEVAEKTGIDYSTLSRIENGNVKKVGDDVLLKLARFFGVSTDFLLGITDFPDKKNYTAEELGLSADAVKNLYTGADPQRCQKQGRQDCGRPAGERSARKQGFVQRHYESQKRR